MSTIKGAVSHSGVIDAFKVPLQDVNTVNSVTQWKQCSCTITKIDLLSPKQNFFLIYCLFHSKLSMKMLL